MENWRCDRISKPSPSLLLGLKLLGLSLLVFPTFASVVPTAAAQAELLAQNSSQAPETVAPNAALPATRTITISVEGEPTEITLKRFAVPGFPLATYYPEQMTVQQDCLEEGCAVEFVGSIEGTGVLFFFPEEGTNLDDLEARLVEPEGFLVRSGLSVTGEYTQPAILRYPWAKKVLRVQEANVSCLGNVYLGEANGRVFWVLALFPPETGDGFIPRADAILTNLEVRPR
ncbi:MAG TPA: hypothetical protein V6D29_25200 [Leptolyngbyaceae cyanobacterium]